MSDPIRVLLLDPHRLMREALVGALDADPAFALVGSEESARAAHAKLAAARPDVIVSELMLADTDAISLVRELRRQRRPIPLLVLTTREPRLFVDEAINAGVAGFALKEDSLAELSGAIRQVAAGEKYFASTLGVAPEALPPRAGVLGTLSPRELEVFCKILAGARSQQIARSLCISLKTVESHRGRINRKLDAHSPADLLRRAASAGLLGDPRLAP